MPETSSYYHVAYAVEDIDGGAQVRMTFTYECEGATKPSCVAQIIFRYYT